MGVMRTVRQGKINDKNRRVKATLRYEEDTQFLQNYKILRKIVNKREENIGINPDSNKKWSFFWKEKKSFRKKSKNNIKKLNIRTTKNLSTYMKI